MNGRCAVMQDLNRYLDQQERAEARAELVDARCAALMAPGCEYCPTTAKAVGEAVGEALANPESKLLPKLAAALLGDVRSSLPGDLIRAECENYWTKLALPVAEQQIDAEQKAAADSAAEDRAEMRKWDRDVEMYGLSGMA